jgi:hypothetical protein
MPSDDSWGSKMILEPDKEPGERLSERLMMPRI